MSLNGLARLIEDTKRKLQMAQLYVDNLFGENDEEEKAKVERLKIRLAKQKQCFRSYSLATATKLGVTCRDCSNIAEYRQSLGHYDYEHITLFPHIEPNYSYCWPCFKAKWPRRSGYTYGMFLN
jgi:hypothetical protein